MVPKECLFVDADEKLILFSSPKVAARQLLIDHLVRQRPLRAYGPGGEIYKIILDRERIRIRPTRESKRPAALKELLLRDLKAAGEPIRPRDDVTVLARRFWVRQEVIIAAENLGEDPVEGTRHLPFYISVILMVVACASLVLAILHR